jgi:preprotein translocase subunit SecA
MQEGEAIESGMVTRRIEKAQKKVEEWHFESRKNLLEEDEVMDHQRKRIYRARQDILDGKNPRAEILTMISSRIGKIAAEFLDYDYGPASFAEYAGNRLGIEFQAREFRGSFEDARKDALDRAVNAVPVEIHERVEECLNPDEDPKDWKWNELARALNAKYGLSLNEKELKKIGPEKLAEYLVSKAEAAVKSVDLTEGARYLTRTYGAEALADWMRQKFGVVITIDEIGARSGNELNTFLYKKVREAYRRKDIEFPVRVAMQNFMAEKAQQGGGQRFDRDGLYKWAAQRLGTALALKSGPEALAGEAGFFAGAFKAIEAEGLTEEFIRTEPRSKLREKLLEIAPKAMPVADLDEIDAKVADVFSGAKVAEAEDAKELVDWARTELGLTLDSAKLIGMTPDEARHTLLNAYDKKYRPEMHSVERSLMIEQIDSSWKAHLLVMDSLKSGSRLAGYAQEDYKIVFKREGMKKFDEMWEGIREKVTESVFRMEDLGDEEAQAALWAGARESHAAAITALQARQAQESQATQQTNAGGETKKPEPIRNTGARIGRNDPCHCGSGKKYKNCHMKVEAGKR